MNRITDLSAEPGSGTYRFRLYIAGLMPLSTRALIAVRSLCDTRLCGERHLEVVDVFQQPELAVANGIIVAPTLVRTWPLPQCRAVRNLSDVDWLLTRMSQHLVLEGERILRRLLAE